MTQNEISIIASSIIAEKLGCTIEEVLPTSLIKEDLGADSLDMIEIIMELESTFSITIPDESIEPMDDLTFQQLIVLVEERAK